MNNDTATTTNAIPPVSRVRVAIQAALYATQGVHPRELSSREKVAMARVVALLWEAHDTIDAASADRGAR